MPNPLDPIMKWYRLCINTMRVTHRVIGTGTPRVIQPKHGVLFGMDSATAKKTLDDAMADLARLTVLDLAAVFERVVRLHVLAAFDGAFTNRSPLLDEIRTAAREDIEFWNVSEQLLAIMPGVAGVVRGDVKQVVDYRNWVAHGKRVDQKAPVDITPKMAYDRLTAFLTQAGLVT